MKKAITLILCFVITSFLVSAVPPVARTFWSQNGNSKLNGQPVPVGTVITAYDPDGVLCGQYTVTTQGQIFFDCLGDDSDTPEDEGGEPGDIITFYMNGILATVIGGSAEWQSGYQEVNIEAQTGCTDDSQCTDLTDVCNTGKCNLQTGECYADPKPQGTDCDKCGACDGQGNCLYDETQDEDCAATQCPDACDIDANPFDWDYANDVPNECAALGQCTNKPCSYQHECRDNDQNDGLNGNTCGAECDQDTDCPCAADACIDADQDGDSDDYADYPNYGACIQDCICMVGTGQGEHCEPTITIDGCKEICDNGEDDDDDGKIDCEDENCAGKQGPGGVICCQNDDHCNDYDDDCADGVCTNNECEQQFKPATTVCRAQNGDCDLEEKCTGQNAACPADQVRPNTYQCRASAGICDLAENCDGTNKVCPADAFRANTYECRAATGDCDLVETCTGTSANCPADAKSTAECRAKNGDCDVAENCDGINNDCPADVFKSSDTVCRAKDGECDVEEKCTGESANCPADEVKPTGTECRAAVDQCDIAETCTGTSKDCPADAKAAAGTECGQARNCPADQCNGFFAEFYPNDGHDTCDGQGNCDVYSCAMETSYCTDNDINDGINTLECGAPCDEDADCAVDEMCNLNTCQCVSEICDNGIDDDQDDLIDCKDPDCIGEIGPNDKICCQEHSTCDNNIYCDGEEKCINNECEDGTMVDCSANDLAEIARCDNNPDNNPFTWDYREAFVSECDECEDECTKGDEIPTSTCNIETCGAECKYDDDCECQEDECIDADDDGIINDYVDYPEHSTCQEDCTCTECQEPTIEKDDTRCKVEMKIPIVPGETDEITVFSLPLVPEGGTTTFNEIQEGCTFSEGVIRGVAYWDPLKTPPSDDQYQLIDGDALLYPGQGYFTTQQNECNIKMEGYKFNAKLLGYLGTNNLYVGSVFYTGWNHIGATSETIDNFDTVTGNCNIVDGPWLYEGDDVWVPTKKVEPGKAYYVKTTNDCNLG